MASLRNLAVAILRRHGHRNAAALRRNARDATRVLPLLGITSPRTPTIQHFAEALRRKGVRGGEKIADVRGLPGAHGAGEAASY
jgi:hypothetical protein